MFTTPSKQHKQTAKLHVDLFQGRGVGGGQEEISLPTEEFPTASLVRHPSGSDKDRGVVDESFPFTLASGWISAPSGSTGLSSGDTGRPLLCPHLQPWPHASVLCCCCCPRGPGLCSWDFFKLIFLNQSIVELQCSDLQCLQQSESVTHNTSSCFFFFF